jgi:hypothetical protein
MLKQIVEEALQFLGQLVRLCVVVGCFHASPREEYISERSAMRLKVGSSGGMVIRQPLRLKDKFFIYSFEG